MMAASTNTRAAIAAALRSPQLPLSTAGAVSQPGSWQSPAPAGGAPVRSVQSIPFTSQRPASFPASSYPQNSAYRDLSAFTGQPRLPQGQAGLPNPSPGSGLTPQQIAAMGGWSTDNTGQFSYAQPQQNPAAAAAAQQAGNVAPPFPASVDDRLNARNRAFMQPVQVAANPGMGGAMIGGGQMAPGIAPQGPPPAGIEPTLWAGDQVAPGANGKAVATALNNPAGQYQRANSTNGYNYGRAGGRWNQWDQAPWAQGMNPADQYAAANAMGQMNAQNAQRNANGQAGGRIYQNGQNVGTVGGVSGAQAYDMANQMGQQAALAKATKAPKSSSSKNNNGSWATGASSGSPFW